MPCLPNLDKLVPRFYNNVGQGRGRNFRPVYLGSIAEPKYCF